MQIIPKFVSVIDKWMNGKQVGMMELVNSFIEGYHK